MEKIQYLVTWPLVAAAFALLWVAALIYPAISLLERDEDEVW